MGRSRIAQAYAKCNTQCLYTKMYTCLHNYAQQHKQIFVCVDAIREYLRWFRQKETVKEVVSTRCSERISVFADTSYPLLDCLLDYEFDNFVKFQKNDS